MRVTETRIELSIIRTSSEGLRSFLCCITHRCSALIRLYEPSSPCNWS